jgi:kinesin family protein 5/centromeric protein E
MEEDHKKFLEEIDTMMVDQEQENDQLRKQLQDNMQRLAHV